MKKILFLIFAALAFVACEKEDPDSDVFVLLTPKSEIIDKAEGGTIIVEANCDSFVSSISKCNISEDFIAYNKDSKSFFKIYPPLYLIKMEDIMKYDEYEAFGCKVIPMSFNRYKIIIEPNCNCDKFEIFFNRIIESNEYGKIGGHTPSNLSIKVK